ncbi:MAG: hypothetical protein RL693_2591, partial [Verrucomicrobiota bacterium]
EERLSVADAIAKHNAAVVSPLEVSLLTAGERGGRLESACEHLAQYFDLRYKSSSKAMGALVYPMILLHMGLVVPELPGLVASDDVGKAALGLLLRLGVMWMVMGALAFLGWRAVQSAVHNASVDRFLRLIPLVGATRRHWAMARFCQVFHTGLLAALNMSETLKLAGDASQSAILSEASSRAAKKIEQGSTLAGSLQSTDALAKSFYNAVDTAEQTGTLDKEMDRWAKVEAEMAARAQDRVAEWLPRVFYVAVLIYVASRIIGVVSGYYGQVNQMLESM